MVRGVLRASVCKCSDACAMPLTAAVWWFKNCLCMCYVGGLLLLVYVNININMRLNENANANA